MPRPLTDAFGRVVNQPYVCLRCFFRKQTIEAKVARFSTSRRTHSSKDESPSSVLGLLEERGYIKDIAGDRKTLEFLLRKRQVGFYAGIDPTAPSLHLGHLLPLMVLFWLYIHGQKTVSLIGGATAKVGDPSGRLASRVKTTESVHDTNFRSLYKQVGAIWKNSEKYGVKHGYLPKPEWQRELLNNATWLEKLSVIDFATLLGSGTRLGPMLGRDTVRNKMEKGDGMSLSEFLYPQFQAWDWWHMYKHHGVQVQIGGSDQYGNIIAGMDAIKCITENAHGTVNDELAPMGLTVPLLTTTGGEKFGKSAGNAIWLDGNLTSPFELYGFLLRSADEDVERYLKLFTFVPMPEIKRVMEQGNQDRGKRVAQHLLASEVLELVHGAEEAAKTRAEHQAMRKPTLASLAQQSSSKLGKAATSEATAEGTTVRKSEIHNASLARVLHHAGLVKSVSEGARLIRSGGVYVAAPDPAGGLEYVQVNDDKSFRVMEHVYSGILMIRMGKWKVKSLEVMDS